MLVMVVFGVDVDAGVDVAGDALVLLVGYQALLGDVGVSKGLDVGHDAV